VLYGHEGRDPINNRIKMMNKINRITLFTWLRFNLDAF